MKSVHSELVEDWIWNWK